MTVSHSVESQHDTDQPQISQVTTVNQAIAPRYSSSSISQVPTSGHRIGQPIAQVWLTILISSHSQSSHSHLALQRVYIHEPHELSVRLCTPYVGTLGPGPAAKAWGWSTEGSNLKTCHTERAYKTHGRTSLHRETCHVAAGCRLIHIIASGWCRR